MIPVHIVAGFLGVGKTTALRHLLASREGVERAAIIVNDFGEAGIDAAQFVGGRVQNIPGGCICCTAPEDLVRVVSELVEVDRPDRIWIEPSGLGRPRDVVDMLSRGGLAGRVDLQPTIVIVDPERFDLNDPLMVEQWDGGDILVINRVDLAGPGRVARVRELARAKWPSFLEVYETEQGVVPSAVLAFRRGQAERDSHAHVHDEHCDHPSTDGYRAYSEVRSGAGLWSWEALSAALLPVTRFKGMLRTDIGWLKVDAAGGKVHIEPTAWRRDNRFDLILREGEQGALAAVLACEGAETATDGLVLVDADGHGLVLREQGLRRLAQVDVASLHPKREGTAVYLRDVLALVGARAAQRVVLSAADGLVSEPIQVGEVGEALLVYALHGEALPVGAGGPHRVLVAKGSVCANVKGLVRIRLL